MDEFGPVEAYAMRNSTFEFYRMLSGILIPLGGLVGGILSYKALIWLSKLWLRQLSGVFIVTFEEIFWSIPALLIGILFGSLFSSIVFRIILRDQYKLYINRYDLGLGINAKKLARSMIFVCIILILLSSYVNLVSYTRFTEEGIYIHRAYQFSEQQYLYSEVEKIEEQIRMQKDSSHYTFLITFTDGRKWQPMSVEDSYLSQNYARILEFVSQKSGRPLNQIKTTIKKDDE